MIPRWNDPLIAEYLALRCSFAADDPADFAADFAAVILRPDFAADFAASRG